MEIQRVPSLICKKCGSFRVMMTDDGPECEDCSQSDRLHEISLTVEAEYLVYQFNLKENEQ